MNTTLLCRVAPLALPLLASHARAQTVLGEWAGTDGSGFGRLVRAAGDVDGDGARDLLVASFDHVQVISPVTGLVVRDIAAPAPATGFGTSIAGDGDVDGDGYADVIVGAPLADPLGTDSGTTRVYSGRTGQVLWVIHGTSPLENAGTSVGYVGDLDADHHDDFFVSSPGWGGASGSVRVYSGASGVFIHWLTGFVPGERFGAICSRVGDLNGDGFDELGIASISGACCNPPSSIALYTLPFELGLVDISTNSITSFASGGDLDSDGVPDVVVAHAAASQNTHFFSVYSGTSGALIANSDETFPYCCVDAVVVDGAGDFDGDGEAREFLIGWAQDPSNGPGAGAVYVYRGTEQIGRILNTGDSSGDQFGASVARVPDFDGDGMDEVWIGVPWEDGVDPQVPAGKAMLADAFCPAPHTYCTAKTNSLGCVPAISWYGSPNLAGPYAFAVNATNVVSHKSGLFVWSRSANSAPFQGGTLCVGAPLHRTVNVSSGGNAGANDCSGVLTYAMTPLYMWMNGFEVGDQLFGQFWYRDPQHPDGTGVGLSDALRFRICW